MKTPALFQPDAAAIRRLVAEHPLAQLFSTDGGRPVCTPLPLLLAHDAAGEAWLVGHFAHKRGHQTWVVEGAAGQGYNVPYAGFITMGEAFHNNHHAFPSSAKLGLLPGQVDLGWWLIRTFQALGLAWNVKTPANLPPRPELRRLPDAGAGARHAILDPARG